MKRCLRCECWSRQDCSSEVGSGKFGWASEILNKSAALTEQAPIQSQRLNTHLVLCRCHRGSWPESQTGASDTTACRSALARAVESTAACLPRLSDEYKQSAQWRCLGWCPCTCTCMVCWNVVHMANKLALLGRQQPGQPGQAQSANCCGSCAPALSGGCCKRRSPAG